VKTEGAGVEPNTEAGVPGAAGTAASGSESGPSMVCDCGGTVNGAGIRPCKKLGMGGGGAKFSTALVCEEFPWGTCALAPATGATVRIRIARTFVSRDRMTHL
jgi:hypothetical protein